MGRQIIGIGSTANDGTGDTPRAAGTKINQMFAEVYALLRPMQRPPVAAFAGDSIMSVFQNMNTGSPFFWSQLKKPRLWGDFLGFAIGGSNSGKVGTGHAAIDGTDLNTPAMIARIIAAAPDILFVETGGNDAATPGNSISGADSTYSNVKAFVQAMMAALPNIRIVLFTSPPQVARSAPVLTSLRAQYMALAIAYPNNIMAVPLELSSIDDTTSHAPRGGSTQAAGATADNLGQHPSTTYGLALEPFITGLLDQIGVPTVQPFVTSQDDIFNASTNPYANLWGLLGSMSGNGGSLGANATGTVPGANTNTSAQPTASTSAAELPVVCSVGDTLTWQGNSFTAAKFQLTAAAPLAATDTFTFARSGTTIGNPPAGVRGYCSILVQVTGAAGLCGLAFTGGFASTGANPNSVGVMGAPYNPSALGPGQDFVDGTYAFVIPQKLLNPNPAGNVPKFSLQATFRAGSQPNCTIKVAQLVFFCLPSAI